MAAIPNEEMSFCLDALHTTPDVYESRGFRSSSSAAAAAYDATAIFYVKVSDMRAVFKFQLPGVSPGADPSLNSAIFDSSSNLRYYVFRRLWPTALKINPVHAMMDRAESSGQCGGGGGGGYTADKSLVKHDFTRYIALQLFNTVNGVDLFQNESDILENITYYGENSRVGIQSVLDTVSTMSADITMNMDSSGNKYSTNDNDSITNISRELMRQIAVSAPARLEDSEVVSAAAAGSLLSVPLVENDTLNIRVTVEAAPGQHTVTNVGTIPGRTYNIKLILKNSIGGATDTSGNTGVSDSVFFPNAYPYSSNVLDLPAGTATANAVVADGSPPAPTPLIRYGYQGWYYTNSDGWVNPAPTVRNKINWYLAPNVATSTVGDLQYMRLCLRIFNRVSTPFLTVYTKTTGSGDAGGWYKSKRTYIIADSVGSLTNNTAYCFYVCWNGFSVAPFMVGHSNALLTLTNVAGGAVGGFGSGETLLAYSIGTNSTAARGNVEFILSTAVVGERSSGGEGGVIEKEYGYIPA
jgi:hypothetical protein